MLNVNVLVKGNVCKIIVFHLLLTSPKMWSLWHMSAKRNMNYMKCMGLYLEKKKNKTLRFEINSIHMNDKMA